MKNPFEYKITKNRKVLIYRDNKLITIAKGKWGETFIETHKELDYDQIQMKLAKITGHYKHGNEKTNKEEKAKF